MRDHISINVSPDTWKQLNRRKEPGDSFNDVIRRLLDDEASDHAEHVRAQLDDANLSDDEVAAVVAMHDYVADHGHATPSEIREHVHDGHEAGKDNPEWWWQQLSKPLESLECINRPSQRRFGHEAE